MLKTVKRTMAALVAAVMTVASMGSISLAAEETVTYGAEDFVIADFSKEGTREDIVRWQGDDGYAYNTGARVHKMTEITDEVALKAGGTSYKHDHRAGVIKADGTTGVYNTRLMGYELSGDNGSLGKALSYDYIYMWIYSEAANGQKGNVLLYDKTNSGYKYKQITIDHTGWKLHKIDISAWELSSFNAAATEADSIYFQFQTSGWSVTALEDTTLYIDSMWLSNKNHETAAEETVETPETDWTEADYLIEDFSSENSTVAKWATFVEKHADNITDEVTRGGKTRALKWTNMTTASGDRNNTKLESPAHNSLETLLGYDYLNMWIYSDTANGQPVNVVLTDSTIGQNGLATKIALDYTGWKLHSIDISGLSVAKFNKSVKNEDTGETTVTEAAGTDKWKLLLQCSGWDVIPLSDTLMYVDSIWLTNKSNAKVDMIKDFSEVSGTTNIMGSFKDRGADTTSTGITKKIPSADNVKYTDAKASVELIPSENNYYFATAQLYNESEKSATAITFDESDKLEEKYINIVMYSDAANDQKMRINFDGYNVGTDDSGNAVYNRTRVYKEFNGNNNQEQPINWTGWKVISLPLAGFTKQDAKYTTESVDTADILKNTDILTDIDLHFPSWGNGAENVVEGETYTYYNSNKTKHYDNIGTKVLDNTKLYIDSIYLSDTDMSNVTLEAINTVTTDVSVNNFVAGFKAPVDFCIGKGYYNNAVTVTKDGTAVPASEYIVQQEGEKLYVKFLNDLEYSGNYEIKVAAGTDLSLSNTAQEAVFAFETEDKYDISTPVFAVAADAGSITSVAANAPASCASVSARAAFVNNSDADVKVSMLVAVYNENGTLAGMAKGGERTVAANAEAEISAVVNGAFENCTAKAFIWDMTGIIPFAAAAPLTPAQ